MATVTSVTGPASFNLSPFDSVLVNGGQGTIAFTSSAPDVAPSHTDKLDNKTFGPYGVPMAVVVTVTSGSCSYTVVSGDPNAVTASSDGGLSAGGNPVLLSKGKGIGTRIPFGRMSTISNASATTYHVTAEAPTHFEGIRPIFASIDAIRSYQATASKVSVLSDISNDANLLNNSGTWVTVVQNGQGAIPIAVTVNNARIGYTVPDFVAISSIARTDGGTNPLAALRSYFADTTATALPVYGNGTDSFTNWATRSDGCMWAARQFVGDGVTTPTNFTGGSSATPQSQSPIIGFQYLSRGNVITVANPGDSISEGRGTYLGDGFTCQAVRSLNASASTSGIKYEAFQAGFSGQSCAGLAGFAARALDILNTQQLIPDVMVMPCGSPNDEISTLTAAGVLAQQIAVDLVVAECRRKKVPLVLWTWIPTNYAVFARGSTDSLRRAWNATVLSKYSNVVDLAGVFYGGVDGNGQDIFNATYTTDGIHPNDAGNAIAAPLITAAIKTALSTGV